MPCNETQLGSQQTPRSSSRMTAADAARNKYSLHLHPVVRQAFRELGRQMLVGLDADQCALFGWDDDQRRLVFLQACDRNNALMPPWNGHASALISSPAMKSVLSSGFSICVSSENGCTAAEEKVLAHFRSHALALVPVGTESNRLGVIALLMGSGQHMVEERDARLLDLLATQAMQQIEQQILQTDRRRESTATMKSASREDGFLVAVSRDLQAPLGTIVGLAESMRTGEYGELPAELAQPLDRVLCNVGILIDTVSELAEWARGGIGHFMLYPEWLELSEMLRTSIEELEPVVFDGETRSVNSRRIDLNCGEDLPPVFVDITRIRQVVGNLVLTLQHALPGGQLSITCQVVEVEGGRCDGMIPSDIQRLPDGQWVKVSITAVGRGFLQPLVHSLAETCAQPSGQESTWPEGALGLVIAKRLLALHGSIVWMDRHADSALHDITDAADRAGVTFSFALPLRPQQVWMGRRWQGVEPTVQCRATNKPFPYRLQKSGALSGGESIRY